MLTVQNLLDCEAWIGDHLKVVGFTVVLSKRQIPVKDRVRAVIRDYPLWIGMAVFGFLLVRIMLPDTARNQAADTRLDDALSALSRGETAEIEFGYGVSIEVEPSFDENGNPIDVQGVMSKLSKAIPKLLTDAEEKYGRNHPRTIQARSAMVKKLAIEKRSPEALELAMTNFSIATGPGEVTAQQKLIAVDNVLSTLPVDLTLNHRQRRMLELMRIVDEYADEAPEKATDLYIDLGTKQTQLGLRDDAATSFRSVLSLSQTANIDDTKLMTAHMGLSGSAWKSDNCKIALFHANQALALARNSNGVGKHFEQLIVKLMVPMIKKCGAFMVLQ